MSATSNNRIRKEIAHEAAKLVAVEGLDDYFLAKKKAAAQLGINNNKNLPSNNEVESAIIEYQSLFLKNEQKDHLNQMRKIAVKAMTLLNAYEPRLVGSVLSGTANQYSEITLHIFTDTSELVVLLLEQRGIPFETCERRIVTDKNKAIYFTAFKFLAENIEIVLVTLPVLYIKKTIVDPISGSSMRRAKIAQVEDLINQN